MNKDVCALARTKVVRLEENFKYLRLCEKWHICPTCGSELVVRYNENGSGGTPTGYLCQKEGCNYTQPL